MNINNKIPEIKAQIITFPYGCGLTELKMQGKALSKVFDQQIYTFFPSNWCSRNRTNMSISPDGEHTITQV